MCFSSGRTTKWLVIVLIGVGPAGCGNKNTATVQGKVTYEGEPVESGFVTFTPEGGHGSEAVGAIENGEYKVRDVTIGPNRVKVISTEAHAPENANPTKSRDGANAERLERMKKRSAPPQPAIPRNAIGNNLVVDIPAGSTTLDLPLEKPSAKK